MLLEHNSVKYKYLTLNCFTVKCVLNYFITSSFNDTLKYRPDIREFASHEFLTLILSSIKLYNKKTHLSILDGTEHIFTTNVSPTICKERLLECGKHPSYYPVK